MVQKEGGNMGEQMRARTENMMELMDRDILALVGYRQEKNWEGTAYADTKVFETMYFCKAAKYCKQ